MKKSLIIMLLVLAGAAMVQQSSPRQRRRPASQLRRRNQGSGRIQRLCERIQQQNPAQKAAALEAFLQTYSNSVMKEDAWSCHGGYQQAGDAQKTWIRGRVLQTNPNNVRALALLLQLSRMASQVPTNAGQPGEGPQYGQQGLQALQNMKKPDA